jgi:hypothetical protein
MLRRSAISAVRHRQVYCLGANVGFETLPVLDGGSKMTPVFHLPIGQCDHNIAAFKLPTSASVVRAFASPLTIFVVDLVKPDYGPALNPTRVTLPHVPCICSPWFARLLRKLFRIRKTSQAKMGKT